MKLWMTWCRELAFLDSCVSSGCHDTALKVILHQWFMLSEDTVRPWLFTKICIGPSHEELIIFLQRRDLYLYFYGGGSEELRTQPAKVVEWESNPGVKIQSLKGLNQDRSSIALTFVSPSPRFQPEGTHLAQFTSRFS